MSFTRAQYRDHDVTRPWTGEYYNGDTGDWKTEQRDYNHSTWIDPLITALIGIVPHADDVLEIDPLLPSNAWTYWILDGQAYRGHDITILYDARGGRYAAGLRGGTGERFDWALLAARRSKLPLILGGGLDAEHVAAAIATAHPFAVDVASGVELEPGIKDPDRLRAFFAATEAVAA